MDKKLTQNMVIMGGMTGFGIVISVGALKFMQATAKIATDTVEKTSQAIARTLLGDATLLEPAMDPPPMPAAAAQHAWYEEDEDFIDPGVTDWDDDLDGRAASDRVMTLDPGQPIPDVTTGGADGE